MSVIGSNILAGASGQGGGYNLTKSLRFRSSASAYLNRTPATASNRKTWTVSFWYKPSTIFSNSPNLFQAGYNSAPWTALTSDSSGTFDIAYTAGSSPGSATSAIYRDPAAWYHVVWATDTTQATASDRMKFYINGVLQTLASTSYPSQNFDTPVNNTVQHSIGGWAGQYFDGYMAEFNLIDGQALTPSSFGETSTSTGVWIPKKYSGSYGTNGFYLDFEDTSSTAALGTDFSGNSNTWTVNNISLTSGSTYDSMTDVPTLTSATTANYATFNPLIPPPTSTVSATYSNGNLTATCSSAGNDSVCWATMGIPSSGLWYWEVTTSSQNTPAMIGIAENNGKRPVGGSDAAVRGVYSGGGQTLSAAYNGSLGTNYSPGFQNTTVGVALDMTNGAIYISVNGTYLNSGVPTSGASRTGAIFTDILSALPATGWIPSNYAYNGTVLNGNYGQRPFSYTPPAGFVALNTFNLPTPTIGATASSQANEYFDVTTYTGNGTTQSITNSGSMQPDWVWLKCRSTNYRNQLYDSVRGATKALFSDSTDAEGTFQGVTAFNANGFSLGAELGANASGDTFVGWQWRASNTTAVTNTQGSITSTVSASTTAGFSIVTYTGNGVSGATIGHGLGATPAFYVVKQRTAASTTSWYCYHQYIDTSSPQNYAIYFNLTLGRDPASAFWNNTAPTSSVFSLGTSTGVNDSGGTYVAYCFAPVAGYSAFGSYTGNGSSDGPFIFTGFRPRWIMIKSTVEISNWFVYDTARDTYNTMYDLLFPSSSQAEYVDSTYAIDALSNGFKIRGAGQYGGYNNNGNAYIYACFAESPLKYANAR